MTRSEQSKLVWIKNPKPYEKFSVNPNLFLNVNTKEVAYLLGLIWADGNIYKNKRENRITVQMVSDDMIDLLPTFNLVGEWSIQEYQRRKEKPTKVVRISNKPIVDFLLKHDYSSKGDCSADKIISIIPEHLKFYWYRGFFDGDGCLYFNKKSGQKCVALTSSINQNWNFCETLFSKLEIRYGISRVKRINKKTNKLNSYSTIRISNLDGILKFANFIYLNKNLDVGLKRKFFKFQELKSHS